MAIASKILQLKITLYGSKPAIWRRILAPDDYSFFALHVAIQDAFGWRDSHLHQFLTGSPFKRNSHYRRISFPMPEMDMEYAEDFIDERKVKLSEYLRGEKDIMFYEYDFGDSWMHEIELEKILLKEPKIKYPILLGSERACPVEDCGGLGGYYNLLEILKDPKNPEHEDMLDWLCIDSVKEVDPDKFDFKTIRFHDAKKALRKYENRF